MSKPYTPVTTILPGCGRCSRIVFHYADAATRAGVWSPLTVAVRRNGENPFAVHAAQLAARRMPYAECWNPGGWYYLAVPQPDDGLAPDPERPPGPRDTVVLDLGRMLDTIGARRAAKVPGWGSDAAAAIRLESTGVSLVSEWRRRYRAGRLTLAPVYADAVRYAEALGVSVAWLRGAGE